MTALTNHVRSRRIIRIALLVALPLVVALALLLPALGSARTADPVQNTAEPTISGSTSVGSTLTGTNGSWTGNPTTFKYNWRRCPPDGGQGAGNCEGIIDGPSNTYVLQPNDSGFTIRLQVKAWDAENDKGVATSNATAKITGQGVGPTNTGLPNVTGTAAVGQTLTADQGTWASRYLVDFSNDWLRCDGAGNNCQPIGASGTTYVVADADKGSTLRARVTATNPAGTTVVQSTPTAVVPGAPPVSTPPPPPPGPTGAGCPPGRTAPVASVTEPARLVIDRQIAAPTVIPRHSGQDVVVRYRVTDTCGQAVVGALVYATVVPFGQLSIPAEAPTAANGFVSLTFQTLAGFPLSRNQRSVAVFVRARKPGENLLAGISARRLFSIPVGS
jgi:hypothetical protein